MVKLIDLATDPEQYSQGSAVTWMKDDNRQKLQEENFWNAIKPFIKTTCKSVLDIGCGSGWSAKKFDQLKVNWIGLEPASSHFTVAERINPELNIINKTFEQYDTDRHFDCIIAVMVFSHIKDVQSSFKKIYNLLNDGGVFIIVCSTFHDEISRLERNGRKYQVDVIDDDQYVDKAVVGAYGIADINRKPECYIDNAATNGLSLVKHLRVEDVGYSPKEVLVFNK